MSKPEISIKPFGFDNVFRFGATSDEIQPETVDTEILYQKIADLETQLHDAQQARDDAVEAARQEGHEQGIAQARSERAEALLAATDALHVGLDDLASQVGDVRDQLTRDAAQVALCAAEMLAGHAIAQTPGRAFDEALGRALKQVSVNTDLMVHVHPESRLEVEAIVQARLARNGGTPAITIIEDTAIAPNDAHISWADGGLIIEAEARRAAVLAELGTLMDSPDP